MARAADLVVAARASASAGRWEQAEALLADDQDHPDVAYALAETAVDAAFWRRGGARGRAHERSAARRIPLARARRGALDVPVRMLTLRHRYQQLLFTGSGPAAAQDLAADLAALGEQQCADCDPAAGWTAFYEARCRDALLHDPSRAAALYEQSADQARARGDRLAESYPLRHLAAQAHAAGHLDEAATLAYRSLALRQAAAAAPAVAAQQVMVVQFALADGGDPAADLAAGWRALRGMADAAALTARVLDLPFVASAAVALTLKLPAGV
ncbi:MAG: hypothetical protein QOJ50_3547 [Cryptosporangiaceae bacterium]|nr:hypothetical protein [Cryptosporangiaceae bacterium]